MIQSEVLKMKLKKDKLILVVALSALLLFIFLDKTISPGISSKTSPYKAFRLLGSVIGYVKGEYIVKVNPQKTMKGALKGLIDSLDVLSSYLGKQSVATYRAMQNGPLYETGLILSKSFSAFPVVVGIIENSPAAKEELNIGDTISRLDGKSTLNLSLTEAQLMLKRTNSEPVRLKIMRDMETPEIELDRKILHKKSYSFSPLSGTSGILTIHHFFPESVETIKNEVIPKLRSAAKTLIIDLRNCHEGNLYEALKFINLFIQADKIGYLETHEGKKELLSAHQEPALPKLPLVSWTNQATMGPAEAVAAVLKEVKKAKIIGIQTPGLASVQSLFPLEDESALLLTTGIFSPPSGKTVWSKGLKPDVKVDIKDQEILVYIQKSRDSIKL
jgi:C-terminal peptidase prc